MPADYLVSSDVKYHACRCRVQFDGCSCWRTFQTSAVAKGSSHYSWTIQITHEWHEEIDRTNEVFVNATGTHPLNTCATADEY